MPWKQRLDLLHYLHLLRQTNWKCSARHYALHNFAYMCRACLDIGYEDATRYSPRKAQCGFPASYGCAIWSLKAPCDSAADGGGGGGGGVHSQSFGWLACLPASNGCPQPPPTAPPVQPTPASHTGNSRPRRLGKGVSASYSGLHHLVLTICLMLLSTHDMYIYWTGGAGFLSSASATNLFNLHRMPAFTQFKNPPCIRPLTR